MIRSPCILAVAPVILKRVHILRSERRPGINAMLPTLPGGRFMSSTHDNFLAAFPRRVEMKLEND
jgi:hypothetical protein